ncbi:hypothetical protein [Sandarakinorhabdus sp. DWP1-3-1]|uniref:hypothetical protein n=1 Tax=Sandarakinorhabdus sp. DWP1-3-1 TaxID=2804627 RepID=UPI003CF2B19B
MSLAYLTAALLAQGTPAPIVHSVPARPGSAIAATYEARPVVTTRQIGTAAGTRMGTMRCTWKAEIAVERRLAGAGVVRTLAPTRTMKGSRPGDCISGRRAIDRDIAALAPDIRSHIEMVAARDQQDLRAELETVSPSGGQ